MTVVLADRLVLGRNRLLPPRRPSSHAGGAARSL